MEISVVIPALIKSDKQLAMTVKCIELARSKTRLPFKLVIVESGTDYLIDYADIYIHEKVKSSCEKAHNLGFKTAPGEYITLLTNDVYVSDNWLECLLDCFKIKDCGCSTLATTQFNHVKEDKIVEANWWSVAMVTRRMFDIVGYYDERFNGSWSDTDLLLRIYDTGYKMYQNFNCVVEHLVGQTLYGRPEHNKHYEEGRKIFYDKWQGSNNPLFDVVK